MWLHDTCLMLIVLDRTRLVAVSRGAQNLLLRRMIIKAALRCASQGAALVLLLVFLAVSKELLLPLSLFRQELIAKVNAHSLLLGHPLTRPQTLPYSCGIGIPSVIV